MTVGSFVGSVCIIGNIAEGRLLELELARARRAGSARAKADGSGVSLLVAAAAAGKTVAQRLGEALPRSKSFSDFERALERFLDRAVVVAAALPARAAAPAAANVAVAVAALWAVTARLRLPSPDGGGGAGTRGATAPALPRLVEGAAGQADGAAGPRGGGADVCRLGDAAAARAAVTASPAATVAALIRAAVHRAAARRAGATPPPAGALAPALAAGAAAADVADLVSILVQNSTFAALAAANAAVGALAARIAGARPGRAARGAPVFRPILPALPRSPVVAAAAAAAEEAANGVLTRDPEGRVALRALLARAGGGGALPGPNGDGGDGTRTPSTGGGAAPSSPGLTPLLSPSLVGVLDAFWTPGREADDGGPSPFTPRAWLAAETWSPLAAPTPAGGGGGAHDIDALIDAALAPAPNVGGGAAWAAATPGHAEGDALLDDASLMPCDAVALAPRSFLDSVDALTAATRRGGGGAGGGRARGVAARASPGPGARAPRSPPPAPLHGRSWTRRAAAGPAAVLIPELEEAAAPPRPRARKRKADRAAPRAPPPKVAPRATAAARAMAPPAAAETPPRTAPPPPGGSGGRRASVRLAAVRLAPELAALAAPSERLGRLSRALAHPAAAGSVDVGAPPAAVAPPGSLGLGARRRAKSGAARDVPPSPPPAKRARNAPSAAPAPPMARASRSRSGARKPRGPGTAPPPAPEPNAKNQFPGKLRDMLADADATGVIAWRPATRTFLILDAAAFKSAVLPRYFRASAARATAALDEQTAYESFARQMNYYGFIKPFRNEGRFDLLEGELLDITLPAHFDRLVRNVGPRPRGGARADKRKRVRERLTPVKSAQGGCVAGGASAAAVLNFDDAPDAGSHSGVAPEPVLKKSRSGARKPDKKKSRSGARKPKTTAPL